MLRINSFITSCFSQIKSRRLIFSNTITDNSILNPWANYPEWIQRMSENTEISKILQEINPIPSGSEFHNLTRSVGLATRENSNGPFFMEGFKPYKTRPHTELYSTLGHFTSLLSKNAFKNSRGEQSRLICGPKGIGKSASLSAFTCIAPLIYDNIIPLYISFNNIAENEYLQTTTIGEIICHQLEKIISDFPSRPLDQPYLSYIDLAVYGLRRVNKKCFLIIDELDQFYASSIRPDLQLKSLGQLKNLAEDISGSFSTIICGSSTSLPHLITAQSHYYKGFETKFPLVKISPSLNGTKFEEIRLHASPPNDLDALRSIFGDENSLEALNLCCFFGGTNPRHLRKFIQSLQPTMNNDLPHIEQFIDLLNHTIPAPHRTSAFDTYEKTSHLYDELMTAMYEKNNSLFSSLNPQSITKNNWGIFKPLSYDDLQNIMKKQNDDVRDFRLKLLNLTDRMWIIPTTYENGIPSDIYPMTMFQVSRSQNSEKRSTSDISQNIKKIFEGPGYEILIHAAKGLITNYMG